jgi:RimJ/RimL family protein N-acetyltransferase
VNDASTVFAGWAQDKEVTHYLTWRPHQQIVETNEFIQSCLSAWEQETRFPYMITLKENDEVMGMIDPRVEGSKVGIGYVARRAHWGKGYIPEATGAIIEWAFLQPSIFRIYATTDIENFASQRVLEKIGMQCEGVLRKYIVHLNISDLPRDSYMYAIIKQ